MSCGRFAAMIATSTVVMFGLMYLITFALDQVTFSETRLYMAFLIGAVMAEIMLAFVLSMYRNRTVTSRSSVTPSSSSPSRSGRPGGEGGRVTDLLP